MQFSLYARDRQARRCCRGTRPERALGGCSSMSPRKSAESEESPVRRRGVAGPAPEEEVTGALPRPRPCPRAVGTRLGVGPLERALGRGPSEARERRGRAAERSVESRHPRTPARMIATPIPMAMHAGSSRKKFDTGVQVRLVFPLSLPTLGGADVA